MSQAVADRAEAPAQEGRLIELPQARGPLSEQLFAALEGPADEGLAAPGAIDSSDPIGDEDLQLALYVSYELHYASIRGVDEAWEWAPSHLAFRAPLERCFEAAVAALVPPADPDEVAAVSESLQAIVAEDPGPPLSRHMETRGTRE